MNTSRVSVLAGLLIGMLPGIGHAFSITNVQVLPANPVPFATEAKLAVRMITPGMPASLYQPSVVDVSGPNVSVDIFPTSGPLTVIGYLAETVSVGVLPPGDYKYEVRLHPDIPVGWGTRTNRGIFSVLASSNIPPTIFIQTPTNGQTFLGPANILVFAVVQDPDGLAMAATVEMFDGAASIGFAHPQDPGPPHVCPFVFYWTNVQAGVHTLTARVTDERGAVGVSLPVHILDNDSPTNQTPVVTITARDPVASEGTNCFRWIGWPTPQSGGLNGTNTATFAVNRTGPTNDALTVFYQIAGTASNGVDYAALTGVVIIPAGGRTASVTVIPVDDGVVEPLETVVLALQPSPEASPLPPRYTIGQPRKAAAIIVDNDGPRPGNSWLLDGCFHLTRPAANGECYRVESSTDLVHWTSLCASVVCDGAFHFVDPDAGGYPSRFYRLVPDSAEQNQ